MNPFSLLLQHEDVAMPYVQLLADFRDEIRSIAREEKGKLPLIKQEHKSTLFHCEEKPGFF